MKRETALNVKGFNGGGYLDGKEIFVEGETVIKGEGMNGGCLE